MLVGGVGDKSCQDVRLEMIVVAILRLKDGILGWQFLGSFHVIIDLVVQASFQLSAHTCQFLRIGRDVLDAGSVG